MLVVRWVAMKAYKTVDYLVVEMAECWVASKVDLLVLASSSV